MERCCDEVRWRENAITPQDKVGIEERRERVAPCTSEWET